jgi:hypothetical protein
MENTPSHIHLPTRAQIKAGAALVFVMLSNYACLSSQSRQYDMSMITQAAAGRATENALNMTPIIVTKTATSTPTPTSPPPSTPEPTMQPYDGSLECANVTTMVSAAVQQANGGEFPPLYVNGKPVYVSLDGKGRHIVATLEDAMTNSVPQINNAKFDDRVCIATDPRRLNKLPTLTPEPK